MTPNRLKITESFIKIRNESKLFFFSKTAEEMFSSNFFPKCFYDSTAGLDIIKHQPKCILLKLLVKYLPSLEIFCCKIQEFYKLVIQDF